MVVGAYGVRPGGGPRGISLWYADPSARQERAELRRLGLPLSLADNDVMAGIDTLSTVMATRRLKDFRSCQDWLDEVEGYVWDKDGDGFLDRPLKLNNDLLDATRYLVHKGRPYVVALPSCRGGPCGRPALRLYGEIKLKPQPVYDKVA